MRIRIITTAGLLAVLVISSVFPSSASCQNAVESLVRLRGNEYRERVAQLMVTRDVHALLEGPRASQQERLITKIIVQRLSHAEVFEEYSEHLRLLRKRLESSHPTGTRPGYLAGSLMAFAKQGVESRDVEEHVGWNETSNGMIQQTQTVRKHTEEEVRNGRARNRAARMAILEHFLKFSDENSEYEQMELIDVVNLLWGEKSLTGMDDGVPVESLLEDLSRDETRGPSVRVSAITRLPLAKRKGERELMIAVLASAKTDNETENQHVVRQAVDYLKQHDPGALKDIATKIQWKRILIDEALGHPTPPELKAEQDDEIVVEVQE